MPQYKGKRVMVTMPEELHEEVEKAAETETRTKSQMIVVLVQEALFNRKTATSNQP